MLFNIFFLILIEVTSVAESYNVRESLYEKGRYKREEKLDLCTFGTYQTPIHVENNIYEYLVMPAIDFSGYNNYLPFPITLINTGKTVTLKVGQYLEGGLHLSPAISGGLLNGRYVWDSLHFHWGKVNSRGSEHVVNNVRYPMEMHMVHRKNNYATRDEALQSKDGLAVLAFFFELQVNDNRKLQPIIKELKHVRDEGNSTNLDRSFSLFTILPKNTDFFFTYEGSLSSPPCSESVIWMVFPNPIKISFRQMKEFRKLSISENFRDVQPIGQRKIFLRQTKRFIKSGFEEIPRQNISSNLFWLKLR